MKKNNDLYKVYGRIWVETQEGALLGIGRVELLKKVGEHGSISGAAKAMKMSYRQAWELIDSMNQNSKYELVTVQKGGKDGGGASLTIKGENAVRQFEDLKKRFDKFLMKERKEFKI